MDKEDKELIVFPAFIAAALFAFLVALLAAKYIEKEQRLRCYEAHAEKSAAEMVLLCK